MPKQAVRDCVMEGSHQDGNLGEMNHFGLKQKFHSELWSTGREVGQMLFWLLWSPKPVVDLGQCSGTGGTLNSGKIAGYLGVAGASHLAQAEMKIIHG